MRFMRGVWVGATLLLALAGCSKDSDEITTGGSYSPVLTGVAASREPVARGVPNQLTAQVTNVNNIPLRFHWKITAANDSLGLIDPGVLTDSTSQTVTWTPPDSIASWNVTVSVEADDPATGVHYFKTMTVPMSVDNEFTRWTRSDGIQFDPAPVPDGGVLFSQLRSVSAGSSDIYRVDAPLAAAILLTQDFFTATSPTPRADKSEIAFAGKKVSNAPGPSLWLLPWGGGDTVTARLISEPNTKQQTLANPRFSNQGARLLYNSDSLQIPFTKVWWRDVSTFMAPVPLLYPDTLQPSFNLFLKPNWGPDVTGDGLPDSVVVEFNDFFGGITGFSKYAAPDSGRLRLETLWLSDTRVSEPDWSPDGTHIVFARKNVGSTDRDIWIINRAASDISAAVRITSGPADDSHPRFSRDGASVFFVSNRVDRYGFNGNFGIERRGANIWSVARFDRP